MANKVDPFGYATLVESQRQFFSSDKTKPIAFRQTQLQLLKSVLKKNEDRLYEAIHEDFSKSSFETYVAELALLYHDINEAIKKLKRWSRPRRVKTNLANQPGRSVIYPEPLGNALVIGAWNYPYQLSLAPVVAAIAAGNTVVLKPSELPVHSAAVMHQLVCENFESRYFSVVEGGVPETTALLEQVFNKIFFTGSVPVGRIVYQAAAKNLTPVTLELGGKSPTIVLPDCDLSITARRIAWGKFLNSGQTCIAPDYVFVHASIKDRFLRAMQNEIEKFYSNGISDNYVQIINEANFERLNRLVEQSQVYSGGGSSRADRFIEPTLLHPVDFSEPVMQEEIFGPLLPVLDFDDLDWVVERIKSRPKPLACYVFSRDKKLVESLLVRISFGGGAVNDTVVHIANSSLPFGGVGQSGIGNYHGEAGFRCFSHYKSVLKKPFWGDLPLRYSPYSVRKKKWIGWFLE